MTEKSTNKQQEIIELTDAKASSKWAKFTSNKWLVGLSALALLGAGGLAGAGVASALVYKYHTEAVGLMTGTTGRLDDDWDDRFDDDYYDLDDQVEHQVFNQLTTKVDFKMAMETALKEAGTGFVKSIHLDIENGKAVYEVETFDGQTEKDYTIDADSGAILRSEIDSRLDTEEKSLTQPKQSVTDILATAQAKYTNAKITDISLDRDPAGKWIYEVEFLEGNVAKTAYFDTENGQLISEERDFD